MNRRKYVRIRKRMACTVTSAGRRHSGVVLDVSPRGLFIQTNAKPDPSDPVRVEMSVPTQKESLVLEARVRRIKVVPPQLLTIAQGGLGLELENAPEAFYTFIASVQRQEATAEKAAGGSPKTGAKSQKAPSAKKGRTGSKGKAPTRRAKAAAKPPKSPPKPPPEPKQSVFRVRASQLTGSRSQSLIVSAVTERQAREQVLAELGEDWKILEVNPG